jgi:hypothetical protein
MTEHLIVAGTRRVHLVQLRVADAAGELLDHDLVRPRIGKTDFVDL